MPGRVDILGIPVDAVARSEVLLRCGAWMRGERLRQVVTANPELVLAASRDALVREVLGKGSLVVPDGAGLLWAARRSGVRLPERIPGVDLLVDLCRLSRRQGNSVFLLGGREGVAEAAAERLRAELPGLQAHSWLEDHRAEDPPGALWSELARVRPSVLFVAYGAPRQELWIARHRERLETSGVRIAMGVGGAFDILAGRVPRAPRWMRQLGLEWLWRLLLEPRRFPRVVRATILFPLAVMSDARIKKPPSEYESGA